MCCTVDDELVGFVVFIASYKARCLFFQQMYLFFGGRSDKCSMDTPLFLHPTVDFWPDLFSEDMGEK